jgi:nucleotide-binding universal stress UspA family protein
MTSAAIVCGVDGSEESLGAVRLARRLGETLRLRVILVHVTRVPPPAVIVPAPLAPPAPAIEEDATEDVDLEPARRLLERVAVQEGLDEPDLRAEVGNATERILRIAEEESAELIVVGSRRRGLLSSIFLGSVSATLVARAPCAVAIVPGAH